MLAGALEVVWAVSMKHLPVGTAYAAWTGIGAVGAAILGMLRSSDDHAPVLHQQHGSGVTAAAGRRAPGLRCFVDSPANSRWRSRGLRRLVNSAIEAVVDRISLEAHPLSRVARDYGSVAVALAVFMAILTWLVILGPHAVTWVTR
jgi:hypothetical protein